MLPFTVEQFFDVFAAYNRAVWPAQIVAFVLGAAALVFVARPGRAADRWASAVLAAMWLWTGIAYHGLFFAEINKAATVFAALFVAQGMLFLYDGVIGDRLSFAFRPKVAAWVGASFVLYAAVLYPLIGALAGHDYPRTPMFGITPCPVTIFTLGALLMTSARPPARIWVIPILWSVIGGSAAFLVDVRQDWLLLFSGAIALVLRLRRHAPA